MAFVCKGSRRLGFAHIHTDTRTAEWVSVCVSVCALCTSRSQTRQYRVVNVLCIIDIALLCGLCFLRSPRVLSFVWIFRRSRRHRRYCTNQQKSVAACCLHQPKALLTTYSDRSSSMLVECECVSVVRLGRFSICVSIKKRTCITCSIHRINY